MRLIDADHLKKWILQRWEEAYPTENLPTREVLEQIDREIAYEIVEEDIQKWIPVSERLPEESGSYFVSGKWASGNVAVGDCEYNKDDGYFQTSWNFDVLAWMPLPNPYKGDEE